MSAWGQSDLYYVARLSPASDAEEICPDPDEISECCWMDIDEFVATQDHPLITAVLKQCYGVERSGGEAAGGGGERCSAPLVEMIEGSVQWPGRDPYPTYFAETGRDD